MAKTGRTGAGCHACAMANELVRGAKCAMHESSTSPTVNRQKRVHDKPGDLGPVPRILAGYRT